MSEISGASLADVHSSVDVPSAGGVGIGRKLLAFGGPAYLVSVGYMDPGNWATDLEGGSRFGYELLWVLVLSNLMAILLQTLSARLGIVTGRDLAQACRDHYAKPVSVALWILCEIAIAACDLAEVLGTAIALNLLFGLKVFYGVLITAFDVLLLLGLQKMGMRKLEALIISLVFVIGASFAIEMFLVKPSLSGVVSGLVPRLDNGSLYVAIGIIGATVMPHNLYLHSALVQTRRFESTAQGRREACKFNFLDSFIALNGALFINGAILVLAASVFFAQGTVVTEIQQAHSLLTPLLGNSFGSTLFAIALLASGQSSTVTGTLAGQIVMEGFVHLKIRPVFRRLFTRALAIAPAAIMIWIYGDTASYKLLLFSQVLLSMQLAFAIVPLIHFTGSTYIMGEFANKLWVKVLAWLTALLVIGLNVKLVWSAEADALVTGGSGHTLALIGLPVLAGLGLFLLYIGIKPLLSPRDLSTPSLPDPEHRFDSETQVFHHIGVAVERSAHDKPIVQRAVALARQAKGETEIVLIHIAVSAQSQIFGKESLDSTARQGENYIRTLAEQISSEAGVPTRFVIGYGNATKELIRIVGEEDLDIMIMGAHGHRGMKDLVFGATISAVRHAVNIPILVIK